MIQFKFLVDFNYDLLLRTEILLIMLSISSHNILNIFINYDEYNINAYHS